MQRLKRVADLLVVRQASDLQKPAATLQALLGSLLAGNINAETPRRRPWIHVGLDDGQKLLNDYSQGIAGSLAMAVDEKPDCVSSAIFQYPDSSKVFNFKSSATPNYIQSQPSCERYLCNVETNTRWIHDNNRHKSPFIIASRLNQRTKSESEGKMANAGEGFVRRSCHTHNLKSL